MNKLLFLILVMVGGAAYAETPPARVINSFTYDGAGVNAITSTTFGGVKSLDINVANTLSVPANAQIVVSGAGIDPRVIRALTASDVITANQGGTWNINNITGTISLPTGAATETTLSAINGKITTTVNGIKVDIGASVLSGTVFSKTQDGAGTNITSTLNGGKQSLDVNVSGSVLPTGASTEATLSALNTKVVITANGIKVDGSAVTQPVSVASMPLPTGAATEVTLAAINTKTPALGQTTMVGSSPVVIASNQSALTVTNSNLDVLLSTRATEATLATRATEATLSTLNAKIKTFDLDTGGGIENAQGVNLRFAASGGSVQAGTSSNPIRIDPIGITVQPVNGTVTANIGTVGTLALEATQLAMSAKLPATLGQKTMANSFAVVLASDQSGLAVSQSGTWNLNNITGTISLPTGAATSALQSTLNAAVIASQPRKLQDGNGNIVTSQANGAQRALDVGINVAGVQIDPRSIRALTSGGDSVTAAQGGVWNVGITGVMPLPVGASTEAKQDVGNTTLSTINGKLLTYDGDTGAPAELIPGVMLRKTAAGGSVEAGTATNPLRVDVVGVTTQPVSVASLPLPAGAATAANQTSEISAINAITAQLDVDLSTRASEVTLNALNSKFSTLGQKTMGNSVPVVIASDQSAIPISGTVTATIAGVATAAKQDTQILQLTDIENNTDGIEALLTTIESNQLPNNHNVVVTSSALPTGAATSALQTSGNASLTSIDSDFDVALSTRASESTLSALSAKFNSLGQKTMTNSAPVVLSSDQSAIPVTQSGVWSTGRTWALSSGTDSVAAVQSGTWNINNVTGTISLPTGAATSALQTTGNTSLSNIDTKLPATLGQKTMANSLAIVIASDQSAVPSSQSGTWNINNVTGTVSLPTGAATSANQTTQITSLQLIDNLPHDNDTALSNGAPIMGQLDDTATGTVTENNVSTARITSSRGLHINLRNNAGTEIGTAANPLDVDGAVAHATTDSGNPVKIGGKYNATLPALTSGQRGDSQLNAFSENVVQFRNKFQAISGAATTTVKSGAGRLHMVCITSAGGGGTLILYDNTAGSGTVIFDITNGSGTSAVPFCLGPLGAEFATGITAVTTGAGMRATILWQ